jgi:hypothetical protein
MSALPGMKEITRYCNRSESTILKWIRILDFPAAKFVGGWESDTELVDEWRKGLIRKNIAKNGHVKRKIR